MIWDQDNVLIWNSDSFGLTAGGGVSNAQNLVTFNVVVYIPKMSRIRVGFWRSTTGSHEYTAYNQSGTYLGAHFQGNNPSPSSLANGPTGSVIAGCLDYSIKYSPRWHMQNNNPNG